MITYIKVGKTEQTHRKYITRNRTKTTVTQHTTRTQVQINYQGGVKM